MTGHEDNVGFLATGSGVQQFQLSLWGSFVLPCRRFFPDLRSTTHTSSLRASAAAHSEGSPSGLTKHAQVTTCRENDGSTLANLPAGDTQRVSLKSPLRANRTPGPVRGAPGNRCPYLHISISFLSLVALFALTNGCSTVKKGDASVSRLPKNTIVIRNQTAHTLEVIRNIPRWSAMSNNREFRVLAGISPHQELVLSNVTSQTSEHIKLDLLAIGRRGCLLTTIVHKYHFGLQVGTNNPPVLVTIRNTLF